MSTPFGPGVVVEVHGRTRPAGALVATVLLFGAWLGAAIYFSTAVAQAAFTVLPSRALAGALVARTLPPVFWSGLVVGLVVAALALRQAPGVLGRAPQLVCGLAVAALSAIGQFVVGPRIDALRRSLGASFESLPASDPARALFGRLHALSVLALGVAMLVAAIAEVLAVRALLGSGGRHE